MEGWGEDGCVRVCVSKPLASVESLDTYKSPFYRLQVIK